MFNYWPEIYKPTFVIEKQRTINNISEFIAKFQKSNTIFRPHFKTHQSAEVGEWFHQLGVKKISVSSVDMAFYFYNAGWRDISIVFPFNRREIDRVNMMSSDAKINILVEDKDTVDFISAQAVHELGVFIKIDCGYQRTGIDVDDYQSVETLARAIKNSSQLKFKGILSHFGNTYSACNSKEVEEVYNRSLTKMQELKERLLPEFLEVTLSIGDTPSASIISDFDSVDEMRPGNFVFYDWMQKEIGSCTAHKIAAIMLCPVVAKHTERNELVIHGGAVHFSKEKGQEHYGQVVDISEGFCTQAIKGVYLKSLSQEHGIVHANEEFLVEIEVGDLIGIIPIHSCLTANLMKEASLILEE